MKVKFTAKDASGKTVKGVLEAGTIKAAAGMLRERQMMPMSLAEVKVGLGMEYITSAMGVVSDSDLTNFTRQLSTMITSGLPLTDALNLLKIQSSASLAKVVGEILVDVQAGIALSTAMAKHPRVFSRVYIALVKAGEAAGLMEKVLNRLAENAEKSREFKGKVKGAMVYPVIILIGMTVVMALMVVLVIPKLAELYKDFDSELPAATKMILAVSDFSVNYWWAVIIGVVGAVIGMRKVMSTDQGQTAWGKWIFKLPVIGILSRQTMLTEFCRTGSLLLSAGVSIVETLRIISDAVGNVVVEREVKRIANQVEKGFPVSISFSESAIFPPIIGQMVAVGEETGKLDEVLAKLSHYFETESEQRVKGLTTAIEPIILMVMAVAIGFLMYAIIMPLYDITNKV